MKDTIGIVVVWLMILIAGAGVSILLGIFLAYQFDVLSTKAPDIWAEQREKS